MRGARFANYRESYDGISVRVICPCCGAGGASYITSYQPFCHVCKDRTLMLPASNTQVECTWIEAVDWVNSNYRKKAHSNNIINMGEQS